MSWGDTFIRYLIPPSYRPDPSVKIEEALEAQRVFIETSAASTDAAEEAKAGIQATTEKTKMRMACDRSPDPRIKAAREALKVLERRQ